jgi:cytochrome b561
MSQHTSKPIPNGYTRIQIILHWAVFVLVAAQFVLHDGISHAFRDLMRTGTFEPSLMVGSHIFGGILIMIFALWRIAIKLKRGAPQLPEDEPKPLKLAAHATHLAFYALLILLPASGLAAWFGQAKAPADAHEVMKAILLALVALHILGALYQQFILKTNILARMKRADTTTTARNP